MGIGGSDSSRSGENGCRNVRKGAFVRRRGSHEAAFQPNSRFRRPDCLSRPEHWATNLPFDLLRARFVRFCSIRELTFYATKLEVLRLRTLAWRRAIRSVVFIVCGVWYSRQVQLNPVDASSSPTGHLTASLIRQHLIGRDTHHAHTAMVAVENTLRGSVLPLDRSCAFCCCFAQEFRSTCAFATSMASPSFQTIDLMLGTCIAAKSRICARRKTCTCILMELDCGMLALQPAPL